MLLVRRAVLTLVAGACCVGATGCGQVIEAATNQAALPSRDAGFCAHLTDLDVDLFDPETAQATLDALIASAGAPELREAIQTVADSSRTDGMADLEQVTTASLTIGRYLAACGTTP